MSATPRQVRALLQTLTKQRTGVGLNLPGGIGLLVNTPRGHVRPDNVGRERPPADRVRAMIRGQNGGALTPQIAIRSFIRAASAAAKNAATTAMDGEAEAVARQ